MATDEQIGRNLTQWRGSLSQKDLAARMREYGFKWSQATVWSIEKGERPLRFTEAEALGSVFDRPFSRLLSDEDEASIENAIRHVAEAERELRAAVKKYADAQLTLAFRADSVDGPIGTLTREGVVDWLEETPMAVVRSIASEADARGRMEMALAGETDEDLAEFHSRNGPFVQALSRALELESQTFEPLARLSGGRDGEHQEEA